MKQLAILLLLTASPALADEPAAPPVEPVPAPEPEPEPAKTDPRLDELTRRLQTLEDELSQVKDDNTYLEEKLQSLLPIAAKLGGYIDAGFFVTDGNGAGTRSDLIGQFYPEYLDKGIPGSWVFMGDPLSTTVNSRGDVADTGESRAIVFDPINSRGKSTFLVNAVNLALFAGLSETASAQVSVDFVPRARDISDVGGVFAGDYVDVKLAYGEWKPKLDDLELSLQAGKFDSVLGFEYRSLESPDRLGITPSLICRYLCGRPIGLKARARLLDNTVIANVAVTNGTHFSEGFTFADETDSNHLKTVAGRLSYLAGGKVELGASGAFGAQDQQTDSGLYQWHVGADVHAEVGDLELTVEYVKGKAKGKTSGMTLAECDDAPCLDYQGAYLLGGYRLTNVFVPYARVDWRDATHESGASFVYISKLVRFTVGLRAEIGTRVIVKAEATLNRELDRIPQFPNDVITTSLVLKL
ncbi:MAG: outer membrane beta-barrel protein [Myxococcales bacterium]|nr:outer membrane beta-barrel protein [Myxococcales bacterium]